MTLDQDVPHLSVVVKCLNEEKNLERCLGSLAAELSRQAYQAEIILADSRSSDRSIEIARRFDVTIVQLARAADRGCSSSGCLGWQFVRGRFMLLIDGDMVLLPGFLAAALAAMDDDERLGAVGGQLTEMSDAIEYRERQLRRDPSQVPGLVDHVTGCGLYRTKAIADLGYFMNRNLHAAEEFELGLRLQSRQWKLRMLDVPCVRHYGHRDASLALLVRKWRNGLLRGYGELLRAAWGRSYFRTALWYCRLPLAVLLWYVSLVGLAWIACNCDPLHRPIILLMMLAIAVAPFMGLLARKRSVGRAVYALTTLQFAAAGLVAGVLSQQVSPETPLDALVLRDRRQPSLSA